MSLSKFKKPYKVFLAPYYYDKVLKQEPCFYSLVFLKPGQQKIPANAEIHQSTNEVELHYKRQSVLVYKVKATDHEKRQVHAELIGLTRKAYYGVHRYPPHCKILSLIQVINGQKLKYNILVKDRLSKKEKSTLKQAVKDFLLSQIGEDFYGALTKIATKDLHEKAQRVIGASLPTFKGLTIEQFRKAR